MSCLIRLVLLVVAGSLSALVLPDTALAGEADSQSANSVAHSFPASPFQPDLTPDCVLIEGDIQVHFEQYWALRYHGAHLHAVYGGDDVTFWPKGVVPYDFVTTGGGAVSAANQQAAINAMAAIAAHAGLTFRPAVAGDDDRIRFQDSNYNSSCVGVHGGAQIINIVSWGSQIAICHEIYHSLGFHHEQSRSDREDFVTINWDSICGSGASPACTAGSGCCGCVDENNNCIACRENFEIEHAPRYGPYDFGSIMHYPGGAFSCNGAKTITVNPAYAAWQNLIGHATNFSYFDVITMVWTTHLKASS